METVPAPGVALDVAHGYDHLRESCGVLQDPDLAFVELAGDDRKGWLQGQVTNDLRNLQIGGYTQFCLVSVTGQIETDCGVWSLPDRLVVSTSRGGLPFLLDRIEKMVILEDVRSRVLDGDWQLLSVQGPEASSVLSQWLHLPSLDAGESRIGDGRVVCLRSNRTGFGGWDLLLDAAAAGALQHQLPAVSQVAYDIARLEFGIPLLGRDIDAKTFPPELGPAYESRTMNYHKGCYVGQEVLMRLHARGRTQRTWMGLVADAPLTIGGVVSHTSRPDAGVVTSSALSPRYGHIAGAFIRREAAFEGEIVTVGGVEAEVVPMPLLRLE